VKRLVRIAGLAATGRSRSVAGPGRAVRSWPLLVLAAPAAAEGVVRVGRHRAEDRVRPGLSAAGHLALTAPGHCHNPPGVEAYAAYALRAWLSGDQAVSDRTRRFAKRSAIFSFTLGMAGQIACHLMTQAGVARAPWPITTVVSCLPVLVLGMGTALAHMLRADAEAMDTPGSRTGGSAVLRSLSWSRQDQAGLDRRGPEADQDPDLRRRLCVWG